MNRSATINMQTAEKKAPRGKIANVAIPRAAAGIIVADKAAVEGACKHLLESIASGF